MSTRPGAAAGAAALERTLVIVNRRGLHARAAAKFVALAGRYECEIEVARDGESVSGRSIMGLMLLAASAGRAIRLSARGPDAEAALDALAGLVERGFDED